MLRTSEDKIYSFFMAQLLLLILIGGVLYPINQHFFHVKIVCHVCIAFLFLAFIQIACYVFFWSISHYLVLYGFHYSICHARLMKQVKTALLEAGYYLERYSGQEKVADLPRIKIKFNDHCSQGILYVQNHVKFNKRLEDINLSSALGKYIVEQQYLTDDENYYVYEFVDSSLDKQIIFENYNDFAKRCNQCGSYELFIDDYSKNIPLHHALICGQTGAGKSYTVYTLILQFLAKDKHYNLYFADPKLSGLSVIGSIINHKRTATEINAIIQLLKSFHNEMSIRMDILNKRLHEDIDGTYATFGLEPYVFLFDEYLAFSSELNNCSKAIRDEVNSIMSDIVLKGRQLGFFVWLLMQQAPANQLATSIRDNLVWKIVLGNSEPQTYITAFGSSADIPARKFLPGHGVYTYSGLANKPKVCAFPTIKFDILETINTLADRTPVM